MEPETPSVAVRQPSIGTQLILDRARQAVMESPERPALTQDGTGGVYMIREHSDDSGGGSPLAVFKPDDEEAGSARNPRGLVSEADVQREGFRPGGGATREAVAYMLDRGFAGVPRTAVERLLMRSRTGSHLAEQSGSVQQFVPSDGDASDFRFDGSEFNIRLCQRLAVLDCRLFNCDRHEGNVLVRGGGAAPSPGRGHPKRRVVAGGDDDGLLEIVPIDHAFCLPAFGYFREAEFAWRYWVSASVPFDVDVLEYIDTLSADADVEVARAAGLDEASCATLRACTILLKGAVRASGGHLTPKDLSGLLMRDQFDAPSPFERLCARALGMQESIVNCDTGLVDFVKLKAEQPQPEERHGSRTHDPTSSFVPPGGFFARLETLLDEELGAFVGDGKSS
jgi:hypothetical protein